MSEQYFEKRVSTLNERIEELRSEIINPPSPSYKINLAYLDMHNYLIKYIYCLYSTGYPIESITKPYQESLHFLELYKNHHKAKNIFFVKEMDEYMNVLTLLSLGISLPVDEALFDKLVLIVDNEGVHDALVDLLITKRLPDRQVSRTLYFPKFYSSLLQAAQQRSSPDIRNFLSRWYNTCLKQTSSHDLHTLHGGDDSGFNGYWAWEVAGLTYALDIDDTTYQDLAYYPKDLVAFARR